VHSSGAGSSSTVSINTGRDTTTVSSSSMVANSSVTCSRGSQKLSSSSGCADRHQQLQGAGGLEALAAPLSQTLSQHNEAAAKLNQPINLSTNRYQLSIN
jgi:hypothetical protein